ncbi:MAG: DUF1015 domain-containing protein [Candidatus Nitronauta litoralis]|uniref:DUF1015 domain-containing protein n=1 Tax=Candidatus Nitronauta litoralis TaxID=2705533 RepID=A0A7T0BTR5_9BACT|nr:MAG: DUF1015 domain-containing protein [Candidatus Nitronauta litoralis]
MVDVVPFSGFLYNRDKTGGLEQVIAPPYDVIRPEMQDALYNRHPFNVVRLILGKQFPEDTDTNNRYTRAAKNFHSWKENSILVQDASPAFYVHSQKYEFEGRSITRTGFFARVKLEEFERGNICPHEFTLAKAKQDRAQLIRACKANFSPIFGLFSDPSKQVDERLQSAMKADPDYQVHYEEIQNRLWRVTDAETLAFLSNQLQNCKVTIADGHHRYETALGYFQEHGKEVPDAGWVLMFLTNLEADGLAIYPTHRQIKVPGTFNRLEFESRLQEFFEIIPQPKNATTPILLSSLANEGKANISFCVYFGAGEASILRLKNIDLASPLREKDEPKDLLQLDVYQLHTLVLKHILGINTRTPEGQAHLQYNVRAEEARKHIDAGQQDMVIFMNTTPIGKVREMAEKGIRLPQKATYFYPKLLSGLVINAFKT